MIDIHEAHDGIFKASMTDIRVAREFFEHYLPAEVKQLIDLDTLFLGGEFMTVAQNIFEKIRVEAEQAGIQAGIKTGVQTGKKVGQALFFVKQLKSKFGHIPPKYETLIENANPDQLLDWGTKILKANNLQEIFMEIETVEV